MLCLHEQKQMFNEVLDKAISRARSWKAKILSQASIITLVKSVLASIPTYTASTFYLSKNIFSKIDSCLRKFTWGHSVDKNSFFPMSWTKVCKPKDCGGLGIRKLEDTNIAFLAKLGLAMASNLDVKWVQILKAKYLQKKSFLKAPLSSLFSWLWEGIYKSKALVKKRACFQNMIGSTSGN